MTNRTILLLSLIGIGIIVVLLVISLSTDKDSFINPYEDINWQTINYYHVNLHTHTTLLMGRYGPHQAMDKYHELEYHILSLTAHDAHHHIVRPQALFSW